jgi:hypothetical protein
MPSDHPHLSPTTALLTCLHVPGHFPVQYVAGIKDTSVIY